MYFYLFLTLFTLHYYLYAFFLVFSLSSQSLVERLQSCWTSLQTNVNSYMDSDINKRLRDVPSGIKQVNEGTEKRERERRRRYRGREREGREKKKIIMRIKFK